MSEIEGSGGGAAGNLWRKHGSGYYALLAVGTFLYLEVRSLSDCFFESRPRPGPEEATRYGR